MQKKCLNEQLDDDFRKMVEAELSELKDRQEKLEAELPILLLPKDPNDDKTLSLKFAAVLAGMKRRYLPEIYLECILVMQKFKVGV